MKESEAVKAVGVLTAIWPAREVSRATAQVYIESLIDLDAVALAAGIERLKITSEFFPSIAALRREATSALPGGEIPDPDVAWKEVQREIARVGSKRGMDSWRDGGSPWEPSYSHQAVRDAAEAMGWNALCQSMNPEADRAHFMRFYGASSSRAARNQAITPRGQALLQQLTTGIGRKMAELE